MKRNFSGCSKIVTNIPLFFLKKSSQPNSINRGHDEERGDDFTGNAECSEDGIVSAGVGEGNTDRQQSEASY
jgi:hypothetical protein